MAIFNSFLYVYRRVKAKTTVFMTHQTGLKLGHPRTKWKKKQLGNSLN